MTLDASGNLGDVDRQLEQVVGRVKEVCERLQTQEREILRTEQLAAVGHLAAGVAHEVRNPLTGIKMLVDAALRRTNPTPLTHEDLEQIRDEIGRLERTAQGLLDFAKPSRPNRKPQDVRDLVSRAVDLARPRADRQSVHVAITLPDEELVVSADADQFTSLLSNLLLNALDATPPGGEVMVRVADRDGTVQISVADTGTGIDPNLTDRLFTPFATTKATGTGLGLTVASRVARDHGGTLTAATRPGGGACFTVTLPVGEGCDAEVARRG
jgi:signal transduction histidine kinase